MVEVPKRKIVSCFFRWVGVFFLRTDTVAIRRFAIAEKREKSSSQESERKESKSAGIESEDENGRNVGGSSVGIGE